MANRSYTQFFYTPHKMPILIDCNIAIGATGAVGTVKGPGVFAVTRLAVGTYKVQFQDNYYKFFGAGHWIQAPVSGSNVAVTAISPGTMYQITVLGTTTTAQWVTAGVPAGITPAVGVAFLAAATSLGTGQAKILGNSAILDVQVIGSTDTQLGPQPYAANHGGYAIVQCLGATAANDVTLIPADPASGSVLGLSFYLSNSSVVVQGE